jgi:hypothetical protein
VVIPSTRLKGIRVEEKEIGIDMNKEDVSEAPCFDPARQLGDYLTTIAG